MSTSVPVTSPHATGHAPVLAPTMDRSVGMNFWDLAASLNVTPLYLLLAWVRGAPIQGWYISQADWTAWIAANPF